jgi:hypothetical protein
MKDGFTYSGTEFDTSAGSYGRARGSLQNVYVTGTGSSISQRRASRMTAGATTRHRLARFYGALGWKGTDAEMHQVTSAADNYFGVVGPTPVDLPAKH